ncbi:hypothetical protein Ahy_A06g028648 [Arachis hypogaea]|uniref:Protein FAR1-RELATED SEQUENCE n=1 Tax=Arachis hypogaea TaxID=3818 RepID=A0A445CRB7_ARAHY|nr:hypothetical protein Ahy_A06g028648 [Arachis hypogaea]
MDSPDEVVVSQPISENIKNYTSYDEVINQLIGDEELKPKEGMCFGTLEDAHAYYYRYARWILHIPCKGTQEKENSGLNKLNDMPFGSFVGVNYYGMFTLIGCTLLRNEETHMLVDRHMWVPVFFKAEFWAGMKSTQRSESMHDFVATPEVFSILHDEMDSARHKLKEHKESEHQAAHVPSAINSHTRDKCPVSMDELRAYIVFLREVVQRPPYLGQI